MPADHLTIEQFEQLIGGKVEAIESVPVVDRVRSRVEELYKARDGIRAALLQIESMREKAMADISAHNGAIEEAERVLKWLTEPPPEPIEPKGD